MSAPPLLLRHVEVAGRIVDVALSGGRIDNVGPDLRAEGAEVIEGNGGALLPGLHDHHLHLLAAAAAADSIVVGPPEVDGPSSLASVLSAADRRLPPGEWLRAIAYHERVAGDLDRADLDRLVSGRPVRVQHRSGARWTLNSVGIAALDLDSRNHPGIERDADGHPTGRLHRADVWLRDLLPSTTAPDLRELGARLAAFGVTGVTDATPYTQSEELDVLAAAVISGAVPQRVTVTGGPTLSGRRPPAPLLQGPVKIIVDDAGYPHPEQLAAQIAEAHSHGRAVAIHCVTRIALVLALAAWDEVGGRSGDRIEHGAVIPPELFAPLRLHRLTVVTQPAFVSERGDEYRADVEPDDMPHLYRCRTLLDAGVPVGGSSDAPYTDPDPWSAMRAAIERTTPSGSVLGPGERLTATDALDLFLGSAAVPGTPQAIRRGAVADVCLLGSPRAQACERPAADDVAATIVGGSVVYSR